jgi:hypothetical protein
VRGEDLGGVTCTVGAHQFAFGLVPEQEMPIVAVEAVQVAAFAGAFARFAKRYFAQPSHFLQHLWDLTRPRQINRKIAILQQAAIFGERRQFVRQQFRPHGGHNGFSRPAGQRTPHGCRPRVFWFAPAREKISTPA